ncbi:protein kinase [Streptomyces sp. NPDC021093]|uniref:protein kinase domain-containing protein n=1 Tax=Streptomyces sp. NPDC021093 TaxID=3365112 RepID=UPI003791486F
MSDRTYSVSVPYGYRVGPWRVGRALGAGAFGSVYASRRIAPAPGTPVRAALKFLPTGTSTPRQLSHLRELAEREVDLLRRLRSPRLIRMYDVLTVDDPANPELDGATVLVLEEAECSLDTLLGEPPGAPGEDGPLTALLVQVCEGLHQLHRAGWVHGDLKPGNVLLMADRTVRLGDFSTAAELEGTHAYAPAFSTPDYTPPELLWSEAGERGTQIRSSSDIWAFGVLAHVVLTGSLPLPGGTPSARRDAAVRYARGIDELRLSPELPPLWRQIITDCLSRTHRERAAHSAGSLLRRLGTPPAADRSPATWRLPGRRPRLWKPLLVTTALTAVTATLGFTLSALAEGREAADEGYARCVEGSVCFFSEKDGKGEMCAWVDGEKDWIGGGIRCTWVTGKPVKSVYNHGHGPEQGAKLIDVPYFSRPGNKEGRLGCVELGTKENLDVPVSPRSHAWRTSC